MPQKPRRSSPVWARLTLAAGLVLVVVSGSVFAAAEVALHKVNAAIPNEDLLGSVKDSSKHVEDGIGLGLWIVRQMAEAHGGRAVAEPRTPGVAMVVTFQPPEEARFAAAIAS